MTNEEVLRLITVVRRQYKGYKDGGESFLIGLANEFYLLGENDKSDFCIFLINEIEYNSLNLSSLSICLLKRIGKPIHAEEILGIYKRNRMTKTIEWKMAVVELLISLDYLDEAFFSGIIDDDFARYQEKLFYIIVQYCAKTPVKGIPFLSDYYLKNLLCPDFIDFLTMRISYLYAVFIKNEFSYLSSLANVLFERDKRICRYFVLISIDFLVNDLSKNCSDKLSQKGLLYLHSIKEQCNSTTMSVSPNPCCKVP